MSDVGSVQEWAHIAREQEAGHDGCRPLFYMKECQNPRKTKEEGRVVFDQKEYVEIFIPGEKNLRPNRPVQEADKTRWPNAYEQFLRTREETTSGTPVEHWPYLNRTQVVEMKANGFLTVESILDCPDGMIGKLGMNGRDIQKRAKQFLQPQGETETELRKQVSALESQLKERDMAAEQMHKRLEAMEAKMLSADDEAPSKRGPGRPRKSAA